MPKGKFTYYLCPLGTDYTDFTEEEEESKSVKSGYVSSDSST
jgi:hypothetical protein